MVEGLYSGLGSGAALSSTQLDVKMKLLVEAPAAVEDALASLLDHHDATLQVGIFAHNPFFPFRARIMFEEPAKQHPTCGIGEPCSTEEERLAVFCAPHRCTHIL